VARIRSQRDISGVIVAAGDVVHSTAAAERSKGAV
jgi:hypothetical protein